MVSPRFVKQLNPCYLALDQNEMGGMDKWCPGHNLAQSLAYTMLT